MRARYLTKSRFKLAMECPTKLFYTGKREYANHKLEDSFLQSLAEGGFQIGELAKAYYPGGRDIESLDHEQALHETNELLKQENCIIYEAAIKHNNLFVRVDILVKEGNNIQLIEVKSSSVNTAKSTDAEELFLNAEKKLVKTEWKPYVYDIAFQYYVAEKVFTGYNITPYLMLVDKDSTCPTDKLNQKFKIVKKEDGRLDATLVGELSEADLSEKLLVNIDVKSICHRLIEDDRYPFQDKELAFSELVKRFADAYQADHLIETKISRSCKDCEFRASNTEMEKGLKSGYRECFKRELQWEDKDFEEGTIFELRNLRKTDELIEENKIKFSDLTAEDVGTEPSFSSEHALNQAERRWLQVNKAKNNDTSLYINKEKLQIEMEKWTYPLHFIDFETSQPVIPFNKGERPYETIAFQFSHHIVHEDGTIEHKSEYINTTIGTNSNIDFVRHLKKSLENDEGTIFRYSHHENTVLNKINDQLESDASSIEDKDELQQFIHEITHQASKKREGGKRNMVDLCELVEKYFYDPYMKGSTSIKVVLPAILNNSDYIQSKYSKPIYGAKDGIKSLNFKNKAWVVMKDGQVTDPYELLGNSSENGAALDEQAEVINNGGAAMAAYERLQFEHIPPSVRNEMEAEMLKYCELDTLAMVLIYEAWVDLIYPD